MDETPEELEQIRREADADRRPPVPQAVPAPRRDRARRARWRGWSALVMWMVDSKREPVRARARPLLQAGSRTASPCKSYAGILDESLHDDSAQMRANIKAQCLSKIERLKEEDGITVK